VNWNVVSNNTPSAEPPLSSTGSGCQTPESELPPAECEILEATPEHGWIYLMRTDAYGHFVSAGDGKFFDPNDASLQAKYLDAFDSLLDRGLVRSEGRDAYRLTGRAFELRKQLRMRSAVSQSDGASSDAHETIQVGSTQSGASGSLSPKDIDYLRRRRDAIERVHASFEPIHAFFFAVCIDYGSLVEILHAGLPATDSTRTKYHAYVTEIGAKLREMHVLEGRLAVIGLTAHFTRCSNTDYRQRR